jgi:hypothetical protein
MVPVEPDGSAYFTVPARKPLLFQAVDEQGFAVQTMRSLTYLQPGERNSCLGCHERRTSAPVRGLAQGTAPTALRRPPSSLRPGPDGSAPFSYPRLVQPVLDRYCVACHGGEKAEGNVVLTGDPAEGFTRSYLSLLQGNLFYQAGTNPQNAAAALVPRFGGWNGVHTTVPDGTYLARGSRLMKGLRAGHHGVELDPDSLARLALWIDANALFYGTYDPAEQAKQLQGERIEMPRLQ